MTFTSSPSRLRDRRRGAGAALELVEVQHDRLVRPQQIGEDLLAVPRRPLGGWTPILRKGQRRSRMAGGSVPSRYSSAVPRRF
jgi:hypothetical protein